MLLVIAVVMSMGEWHGAPRDWLAARVAPGAPDSCLIVESAARPKKASTPPAPRGQASRLVRRAAFTMLLPANSTIGEEPPLSFTLRDCRFDCGVTVIISVDSATGGLERRIGELMRWEHYADSVNADPRTRVHELVDYRGPPMAFQTAAGRGIALEGDCGDCGAASLFFSRGKVIAEVRLRVDDRESGGAKRLCELAAIGRTFRWRN
jgi:hypothetical protein